MTSNSIETGAIPSLYDELNRKAVEAMVWLEEGRESGQLSPDQVYVAQIALFMALSGLVSGDINALLAHEKPKVGLRQEVLLRDDTIAALTLDKDGRVTLCTMKRDGHPGHVQTITKPDDGFAALDQVRSLLVKKGFAALGEGQ